MLIKEMDWSNEQFEEVEWIGLHQALEIKADGYVTWLSKQVSGFCGTRVMVGRYSGKEDPDQSCPNCGCRENAAHLCICSSMDRTRLFRENVEDLKCWLNRHGDTEPQLAYWIPKSLLGRGTVRFQDLGHMSPEIKELAKSQDLIGWKNLMEGRISKCFLTIQQQHLENTDSYMNGSDWVKQFITKILQITH